MSTIVYQGTLQSCFESQIIETTTLKLKVPSTIEFSRGPCMIENNLDNLKQHQITNKSSTTTNLDLGGGWNFLQNLSNNISSKDSNLEKENDTYVHPLSKRSSYSSRLSDKSLQLCTESLGSETGTDIIDTNIFSLSSSSSYSPTSDNMMMTQPSPPPPSSSSTWTIKIRTNTNKKCWSKFPPPLTTIRGLNSMQIRPHREDGRLIIKAVEAPLTHNYLQAERSNGRLRLCFFKDDVSTTTSASNYEESKENEELEVIEDDIIQSEIIEEEEEEDKDDTEAEVEEESDMYNNMKWDMDTNKFDVEGEMGKEKCQKLSRCKESGQGNKVFCDWRKPLWVATS
ncbi:hypothetical protein K7X08_008437 [Anisodus acutangulus]|uniref:FAF domain-containing protein n=1 Tax=Anisodus acutangulus TaxID=402998 RepID=A0A9Q1MUH6_9SOLA|nr:hypothetical protein K7X08_008437 [Anisodus acutangulus]